MKALDGFWGGVVDVDQAFVNFHFESFTTGLVDMWGFNYGKGRTLGWKRHWARYGGAGADSGIYDLFGALVDDTVVIGF